MKNGAITLKSTLTRFSQRIPLSTQGTSDKVLLFLAVCLAAFGLVMVYSASYIFAQEKFGNGLHYFQRHLQFLGLGFAALFLCRMLDYRFWERYALWIFGANIILLVLTLIPGIRHKAGGASRWIDLGAMTIQPVEFAKVAMVILLAKLLSEKDRNFDHWKPGFAFLVWPTLAFVTLLMLQPDFGSSALLLAVTAAMLYLGGVRIRYLLTAALACVPLLVGAILLAPYRVKRFLTFLDPWADPQGTGFQIVQSFIAFYRGGLFGVGLGNSRAKVFYLPEAHNDFILSVVGEELGFVGIGLLSLAFLVVILRGVTIAARANSPFASLLAAGITAVLGLAIFWNAAIVLGLFPTKGMNLPFISSGGSSVICVMAMIGILLNISARVKRGANF
jgi:cell division protein FtsW